MSTHPTVFTTAEKGQEHETLTPLLKAAHIEMQELSKKKPDSTISSNKAELLNRLLRDVKSLLQCEGSAKYLDLIEEEATLPHHSDVVLMLSQYAAALNTFKDRYYGYDGRKGHTCWFLK